MKTLIISLTLFLYSECAILSSKYLYIQWAGFKKDYAKNYLNGNEEADRFKTFVANLETITEHNRRYDLGLESFEMGINQFADMSPEELYAKKNFYYDALLNETKQYPAEDTFSRAHMEDAPEAIDWSKLGAVTPVKDQGDCSACWAFASTGAIEGHHYIKYGELISLSEQNLIDCSEKYGNYGCVSGFSWKSFQYVKDNNGIATEAAYPYVGKVEKCKYEPKQSGATVIGFVNLPSGNESKLKEAVAKFGPIAVSIDASKKFHLYKRGVFYDEKCSSSTNHLVLVVGYGTDPVTEEEYWIVKNSWNAKWGEAGYVRMARNRGNNCLIASYASYPIV